MSVGTCYVCLDGDDAPKSACKCIDRFIHTDCLLRQVQASGSFACPVCLENYPSVEIKQTIGCTPRGRRFLCASVLLGATGGVVAGRWWGRRVARHAAHGIEVEIIVEALLSTLALILQVAFVAGELIFYARGSWKMVVQRAAYVAPR